MATTSWNPGDHSGGAFSPLDSLMRDALVELGESSPDVAIQLEQGRYLNYANRVVRLVNQHPYFQDMLLHTFEPTTGEIQAGSNELTLTGAPGSDLRFERGIPLRVVGAGHNDGDLYSTVLKPDAQMPTRGLRLAHAAGTTVTNAVVSSPYAVHIPRYTSTTDIRPIDDQIIVDGIKFFFSVDGADEQERQSLQVYNSQFFLDLSQWLVGLIGGLGPLEVRVRDA